MSITVKAAAAGYADYARSLNWSKTYSRIQFGYVGRFAQCCDDFAAELGHRPPLKVERLTPQYIARFYQDLPATAASHNIALVAIRGFVKYLERMRYLEPGSVDWLLGDRKSQKFTRQPKYYPPPFQFGPMLEAAERQHPVYRMTLAMAFYTLARSSEISGLRLKDLNLDEGVISIYRYKRKRWTPVQMCPELWDELIRWEAAYAAATGYKSLRHMAKDHPDWYLCPGLDWNNGCSGYRVNPEKPQQRLERLVKRMLDIFGAQTVKGKAVNHKSEGMHTIRRAGARAMLDYLTNVHGEDKALLMVSTMLDHETTTMTLLYIGRSLEQKRLNAYLATGSMYGDHGRADSLPANVTRMPLAGRSAMPEAPNSAYPSPTSEGEVDAL